MFSKPCIFGYNVCSVGNNGHVDSNPTTILSGYDGKDYLYHSTPFGWNRGQLVSFGSFRASTTCSNMYVPVCFILSKPVCPSKGEGGSFVSLTFFNGVKLLENIFGK